MMQSAVRSIDLKINYILLAKIKRVHIKNWIHGSKPDEATLNRPILRCQKPCNWDGATGFPPGSNDTRKNMLWSNPSVVSTFPNALIAVQQLSYGSLKVRHSSSGTIDDIAIANTIARCANNETTRDSFNFLWAWEDSHPTKSSGESIIKLSSPKMGGLHAATCYSVGEDYGFSRWPYSGSVISSDSKGCTNTLIRTHPSMTSIAEAQFSLLRLCCSTDCTDSETSEI